MEFLKDELTRIRIGRGSLNVAAVTAIASLLANEGEEDELQ
jgi:hypothetical protein